MFAMVLLRLAVRRVRLSLPAPHVHAVQAAMDALFLAVLMHARAEEGAVLRPRVEAGDQRQVPGLHQEPASSRRRARPARARGLDWVADPGERRVLNAVLLERAGDDEHLLASGGLEHQALRPRLPVLDPDLLVCPSAGVKREAP